MDMHAEKKNLTWNVYKHAHWVSKVFAFDLFYV